MGTAVPEQPFTTTTQLTPQSNSEASDPDHAPAPAVDPTSSASDSQRNDPPPSAQDALLATLTHASERSRAMFGEQRPPSIFFPMSAAQQRQGGPDVVIEFYPDWIDRTTSLARPHAGTRSGQPEHWITGEGQAAHEATDQRGDVLRSEEAVSAGLDPATAPSAETGSTTTGEPTGNVSSTHANSIFHDSRSVRPSPVLPMSNQVRRIADARLARVQGIHLGAPGDGNFAQTVRSLFERAA